MSYEVVESHMRYQGHFLSVREDIISLPDGKTASREVVERGAATAILPILDDGRIVLVRQYRHPFEEMMLEVPAGILEEGEEPSACAKRELEEETGYCTEALQFVCEMYPTPGFCMEKLYLYLARNLQQGQQNFDEDEFIEVEYYTLEEAIGLVYEGKIKDGKTITLLLALRAERGHK